MRIPLVKPSWGKEENNAIQRVLKSGRFTMSRRVREFERAFARYHGSRFAVMVNSGSSANLVAFAALRFRRRRPLLPGHEVIVPAVAWSTTYAPFFYLGAKLRVVDIDPDTLNVSPEGLARAITPRSKAAVAVNILGNPGRLPELRRLCDRKKILFLEDNCESVGAEIGGKLAGTFGEISTCSTFFSHHLNTIEGGMILTNDEELHDLCVCLRAHGWSRDLPARQRLCAPRDSDFPVPYRFLLPGFNVRPTEFNAAAGLAQISKLRKQLSVRRKNAAHFQGLFAGHPLFRIQREEGRSSWYSFTFVIRDGARLRRSHVVRELARAGVETRMITGGNFADHDFARHFSWSSPGPLTNAAKLHRDGFFVANFGDDMRAEIDSLHKLLNRIGSRAR